MGGRWALYSLNSMCRRVGPFGSKAMASRSGIFSLMTFINMFAKPKTALVGRPDDVERFLIP